MAFKHFYSQGKRVALGACSVTTALLGALALPAQSQEMRAETKPPLDPPLKYGPFDILYGIRGSVVYDDNIYISHTNKQSDVLWTIAPSVTLGAGDYHEQQASLLSISYTPSFIFFTDQSRNNAIDHDAQLNAQWRQDPWKLGLQQSYQNYSGALVDVGNRVDRQIYNTALEAVYELTPKTSFELDGRQSINNFKSLRSYNEWQAAGWMDYEVMPLLKTGLGFTGGFVDVTPGANQTYQQVLARATYSLTELLDVRASAGGELREFEGGQNNRANPVFTLGATYRPRENTSLKLDAYRRSQASAIQVQSLGQAQDQNYTTTGFSGSVRQVLFENYALNLTGGYENSDYTSNIRGQAANRNDNYFFAQFALDANLLDKLTVGVFYQYRNNDSTDNTRSFDNHQVGLNISYRF